MLRCGEKKYWTVSLMAAGCILLAIAAINYMVDPYNLLGNNTIGIFHSLDREIKNQIVSFDHDAILIGSSKTGRIDPAALSYYKFYNASFDAALPEEIYFYLEKYAKEEKVVLLGLDFYMFNENFFPLKPMVAWNTKNYSIAEYLLGGGVFNDARKSLSLWLNNNPPYLIKKNGQKIISKRESSVPVDTEKPKRIIEYVRKNHFGNFRFSNTRMEYIHKIKVLLEERNIKLLVFINPLHEDIYRMLKSSASFKEFIAWKKKLRVFFPDLFDLSNSPYSAKAGFTLDDPFHYTSETGASFMNKIMNHAIAVGILIPERNRSL